MSTTLSRGELRSIYDALPAPHHEPLRAKLARMIAECAGAQAFGRKIFSITVPLHVERTIMKGKNAGKKVKDDLAPTLNRYGSMQTWQRVGLYAAIDFRIMAEFSKWPRCRSPTDQWVRRGVRATRRSAKMPDEITIDVLGGKVLVDRLVHANILGGDEVKHVIREAIWEPAPPGKGTLTVDVFDLVREPE